MTRLFRLAVLGLGFACALLCALLQCDQPDTSVVGSDAALVVPSLSLTAAPVPAAPNGDAAAVVPSGTVWSVSVCATQHIVSPSFGSCATTGSDPAPSANLVDGLSVTFSSTTTGVTASPATTLTNASGVASSEVVVPFGAQVAVVVSGGGASSVILVPPSDAGPTDIPITLTLTGFNPASPATVLPTGVLYQLAVKATTSGSTGVVQGLPVSFATTTTGVSFSPATATTDSTGTAISNVVVPFDTEVQAVFSGGGAANSGTATAPAISLSLSVLSPTGMQLPGGETYQLTATAKVAISDADGGAVPGSPIDVQGLPLSFATTTTGVAFSPATVLTNTAGQATSYVVVPYGTSVEAVVSGGGMVASTNTDAGVVLPAVTITTSPPVPTCTVLPVGLLFGCSAMASLAQADGGVATPPQPVAGLGVAFATTTAGVSFSPATVVTSSSGYATSFVVVPYGTEVQTIASGGGAVGQYQAAAAPAVMLLPGSLQPTGPLLPGGQVYTLRVQAEVNPSALLDGGAPDAAACAAMQPVAGLNVSFATTTTGVSFSPATVATDVNGYATSSVQVPYGTTIEPIVSGGGMVVAVTDGGAPIPAVTITPTTSTATGTVVPGGAEYAVTVQATSGADGGGGTPIAGLSVAFATTTTGVSFSPGSVVTNNDGYATSYVTVPFGTQVQALFAGGGATNGTPVMAQPVTLATNGGLSPSNVFLPAGEVYSLSIGATANLGLGSDGGLMNPAVSGLGLSFQTNTTGVAFSPPNVPTNILGTGTSSVVIPYGTEVQAIVSGGGAVITIPGADAGVSAPNVSLTASLNQPPPGTDAGMDAGTDAGATPCTAPGPCTVQVGASVNGTPLNGLAVGLVFTDMQAGDASSSTASTISPPSSPIITASDGTASYTFMIPPNVMGFVVLASGAGSVASVQYPP